MVIVMRAQGHVLRKMSSGNFVVRTSQGHLRRPGWGGLLLTGVWGAASGAASLHSMLLY